jgi:hypothetical protein
MLLAPSPLPVQPSSRAVSSPSALLFSHRLLSQRGPLLLPPPPPPEPTVLTQRTTSSSRRRCPPASAASSAGRRASRRSRGYSCFELDLPNGVGIRRSSSMAHASFVASLIRPLWLSHRTMPTTQASAGRPTTSGFTRPQKQPRRRRRWRTMALSYIPVKVYFLDLHEVRTPCYAIRLYSDGEIPPLVMCGLQCHILV